MERLEKFFAVKPLGIDYFGADTFYELGLKETSILYILEKKYG